MAGFVALAGARWTRKPPPETDLDRTHPLCPDHGWPFLSPQGTAQCFAKNAPLRRPAGGDMLTSLSLWVASQRYGRAVRHTSQSDIATLTAADAVEIGKVIPSSGGHTLLLIYKKNDSTLRNSSVVGCSNASANGWYGIHGLPWTDGNGYWRYGGNATEGTGQLTLTAAVATAAGVNYQADNVWTFTTGPRGMEIIYNGRLVASNSSNTTYTPAAGDRIAWNAFGAVNSDLADLALVMTWRRQLAAAAIHALSINPWQVFQPRTSLVAGVVTGITPAAGAAFPALVLAP